MTSSEVSDYYLSTLDTIDANQKKLEKFILKATEKIPYPNPSWNIYGSNGNILFSTNKNSSQFEESIFKNSGITINQKKDMLIFTLQIFYKFHKKNQELNENLGFISVQIPIDSIARVHKKFIAINSISSDLSAKNFRAQFQKTEDHTSYIIMIFYFYIFIFILFNCISTLIGIKMLQRKMSLISSLQSEIHKSSKLVAVGNIAHMLAHDIQKPFSKIFIFIDMLKKCQTLMEVDALLHELAPSLETSSSYIEHILSEITDAGITKINVVDNVKLDELIQKTTLNLSHLFQKSSIELNTNLKKPYILKADSMRLMRVFSNLISNAFEAMGSHGKIWIHADDIYEQDLKFVKITIGNNNSYIDSNDIENLFEPFFTKNKENGSGLGLAISQKIIHLHGGKIWCSSSKETGVEFIFTIPEGNFHTEKKYTKIIIVDDDPFILKSWKRNNPNHNLICFSNPEKLLEDIKSNKHLLNQDTLLISDFYFGKESTMHFLTFANKIRLFFYGDFFLSTDAILNNLDETEIKKLNIIQIKKTSCIKSLLLE